jgi:hypothetical protein
VRAAEDVAYAAAVEANGCGENLFRQLGEGVVEITDGQIGIKHSNCCGYGIKCTFLERPHDVLLVESR